jgi:hypothetical protein
MRSSTFLRQPLVWAAALALIAAPALVSAEEECGPGPRTKPGAYNPDHDTVDFFDAMDEGQIEIKVILKDEFQGRVFISNKTDQPLNIKLPGVVAAVPVLAQFCPCGGAGAGAGAGGGGSNSGSGGQQGAGGGMMGGMGGMGGGGMGMGGGGFFNVPAEKVGDLPFKSVCLDHGKASPRPAAQYTLVPLADYTSDPTVGELLKMYLNGHLNQASAQAAAWHFASDMSWDELAKKTLRRATGARQPYFSLADLNTARQAAGMASLAASKIEPEIRSPGDNVAKRKKAKAKDAEDAKSETEATESSEEAESQE